MFASTRDGGEASRELTILGLARTDQEYENVVGKKMLLTLLGASEMKM